MNLMRWRLEKVLGYRWTHPLEIFNERGTSIYHMIFATDHAVGNEIMTSLYNAAANEFPVMREDARLRRSRQVEREAGIQTLFDDDRAETSPVGPREKLYQHVPPSTPYGTTDTL